MRIDRRKHYIAVVTFTVPFLVIYCGLFIYPAIRMFMLSLTDAPLIGDGNFVGINNFLRLARDRLFATSIWNTAYFVVLTVLPSTIIGLVVALGVNRLSGRLQSLALACFFFPYILPVSVVYRIWSWILDKDFGIAQYLIAPLNGGEHINVLKTLPLFIPTVATLTVWWLTGFNVLLFIAGLRTISPEIYEAGSIDGAGRWKKFMHITWPLIWPVTVLVMTIQLILQLKIFDQVYLFARGGRVDATSTIVQYVYKQAFQSNHGGLGAAASVVLFAFIIILSVLQFQLLRGSRAR